MYLNNYTLSWTKRDIPMIEDIIKEIKKSYNKKKSEHLKKFFKTGKGEYGEGDIFLGVNNPTIREIVNRYYKKIDVNNLKEINPLITSKTHEFRLVALLILVKLFEKNKEKKQKKIYDYYVKNINYVNNWDLVDLSASNIVGAYLFDKKEKRKKLYTWAKSKRLFVRRIAIISTLFFIRKKKYQDTLKIAKLLLNDKEDLLHKATGWMLREVGKRDIEVEKKFLKKHYQKMPRTMLRYAIERFEEKERKDYLLGNV